MPGLPLVVHESSYVFSHSRSVDQMCLQGSRPVLPPEDAIAAEDSLSVYCKPVEFYNILQRRAAGNPAFLQRCLKYKIEAQRKQRIHLTVSLSGVERNEEAVVKLLPFYIMLARRVTDTTIEEHSAVYRPLRGCKVSAFHEHGCKDESEVSFIIPELKKLLADGKDNNLVILLLSYGERRIFPREIVDCWDAALISSKLEGSCLWGHLPVEAISTNWLKSVSFNLGNRVEMLTPVDMHPGILKPVSLNKDSCIMFQNSHNSEAMSSKMAQLNIHAQELRGKEKSPYDFYNFDGVPASSLAHIIGLRAGNVIFNYRYYNNSLQKTEVTEDFSCPFCLVQCGSFKGLRCHLTCSHDLFNFEFWVTEEYQAVNVSVKADVCNPEIVAEGVDPRLQTFFISSSRLRKRKRTVTAASGANNTQPHCLVTTIEEGDGCPEKDGVASLSKMPILTFAEEDGPSLKRCRNGGSSNKGERTLKAPLQSGRDRSEDCNLQCPETSGTNFNDTCTIAAVQSASHDFAQQTSSNTLAGHKMLQFAKTRKLSAEQGIRALRQNRYFFHSHRAQPMALEQVLSDQDSEDEVDDDIADLEDQRMLDDFVDVTKDEKQIMHYWNSLVRRQRVLADGHIPWACEAFTKLHGHVLVRAPALIWCWRLLMIKLWNHSLLDARTINNCNLILEDYQKEISNS